ncbi:type I restriction endonuclease subunit R [Paenibacillus donghaensis]|uniref:Type I restriction enzyme endonuclease subunit n=1 Tax=Paenibacillus donghaensis TaxID=414771 RepID=A0A2Z2KMM8_9BACL|nr:type I restriction endonuclease subunit R [Paenibacillus donghaensis]ASA25665.1 restriction endonuclease subunit R [Paenibacillus donghaensis]
MSYQSEAQLEKNLIDQLVNQNYERVTINDYDTMVANFRQQLNKFNEKKLNGQPLTDSEFSRFFTQIDGKSIFDSAKILRDKQVFQRDDGTEVYLELMNTREWCKNNFQVTNQTIVEGKYKNRYDVTLFINGLPVIQVELKRRGLDFKEAFNQIQRYRKHSFRGLYRYLQVFIVSNGVDTKYFANSDGDILFSHTFFWSDSENSRITTLNDFAATFLEKCHMAKMIARYIVLNETEKQLMVMRPYQVYAVEALVKRALETKNNGYIWHTTGSGKTLTSFKASQILANEPHIKKVFFLVDRKDLDSQTLTEFNKFENDSVDMTDDTSKLVQQIADQGKTLIVTTIQKMANAIKNSRYEQIMKPYQQERVIFIIDECHRSQFGKMKRLIDDHFKEAQYFGFTGTPLFEVNKSQDGRATADIFEKCLHTYLIKDAIHDENVLGFSVEYNKTVDVKVNEADKTKVKGILTDEVWMHDERIKLIIENVLTHHERKSRSKGYTGIFTVDGIPMLVKYYDMFKSMSHNFKIAGIFTYGQNEDSEGRDEHSRDSLERIMVDYNQMFGTNFNTDKYSNYFADVSKRVKTAQIDILLVVNIFLTGFDSKPLNILYMDRFLKYHNLIQAFSRTNRTGKATKPYGNIVCYRNLKEDTDEAIKLFSKTDNVDDVLMKSYDEYLDMFKAALVKVRAMALTPAAVDNLEREEDKQKFVVAFRDLTKYLNKLETFTEHEFTEERLGIQEQTYQDYKSKYLRIYDEVKRGGGGGKTSILADVDFSIELMHTDRINVSYIMNLIKNIDFNNEDERNKLVKHIQDEIDRADNEELRLKARLLKEFLDKVVPTLSSADSVDDSYNTFEQEERGKEIQTFAGEVGLSVEDIQSFVEEYEYSGFVNQQVISDVIKLPFLQKRSLIQRIIEFITDHTKRFS